MSQLGGQKICSSTRAFIEGATATSVKHDFKNGNISCAQPQVAHPIIVQHIPYRANFACQASALCPDAHDFCLRYRALDVWMMTFVCESQKGRSDPPVYVQTPDIGRLLSRVCDN